MKRHSLFIVATLLSVFVLLGLNQALASHFRYGHLTWTPAGSANTARFTLVDAFRRSAYGAPVVGSIITETTGNTRLMFGDGTFTPVLQYKVLAFNAAENWIICQALEPGSTTKTTIDHTYSTPTNSGAPWVAEINAAARSAAEVNNPNGGYQVSTLVELSSGNSSPSSGLPPVVNLVRSASAQFFVPAADPDPNTTLTYRLATSAEAGGSGGFTQPSGLTINSTTGLVTWNNLFTTAGQLYSCQVVIEDRDAITEVIKTRVAVDFLIEIVNCSETNVAPIFIAPSPSNGTVFTVLTGNPLSFTVTASDADAGDIVDLNTGGVPSGATLTPGLPLNGNPVSTTFTWTPGAGDAGAYVVSFAATDNCGSQALCAYTIQVIDCVPPTIVCPSNITISNDLNICGGTVHFPTALVLQYDPTGSQLSGNPLTASFQAPGFAAGVLSQVGFENFWVNGDVWPMGRISSNPSIPLGEYLTFTVNVPGGTDFAKIQYSKRSYLGHGATSASIRSSLDGFVSDISVLSTNPVGDQELIFDLSSLPFVSGSITFRIYFWGAPVDLDDWDDLVSTSSSGNGLRLYINTIATYTNGCGPVSLSYTNIPADYKFPVGTTTVTATATDQANNSSTCSFTVTVIDNQSPVITCPVAVNANRNTNTGVCSYTVVGSEFDATATDNCSVTSLTYALTGATSGTGTSLAGVVFNEGVTTVTWTATDPASNTGVCSFTVTVIDNQAPILTLTSSITLWPPNHEYVTISMSQIINSISDNCSSLGLSDVKITSVSSDEPEDANGNGDGNTLNDIVIASDCGSVQLRSERDGTKNGRVYTINLEVSDAAGNTTTVSFKVNVPHDQNSNAVDDGAASGYTVTSSCGLSKFAGTNQTIPSGYSLEQNYPNPFNPSTTISFTIPENSSVRLGVYDLNAHKLKTLVDGEQSAGIHLVTFDATEFPSGIYLYILETNGIVLKKTMNLIK